MIDYLDIGLYIIIGLIFLYIMVWYGLKIKRMLEKEKGTSEEDELNNFMKAEKLK